MGLLGILKVFFILMSLYTQSHGGVRASRLLDLSPTESQIGTEPLGGEKFPQAHPKMESNIGGEAAVQATMAPIEGVQEDRLTTPINWQAIVERLLSRQMGSKPPNCDGKCDLCRPCVAVEVPISNHAVQQDNENSAPQQQQVATVEPTDTNYMPESWRCSCGDIYYNP